MRLTFAAGPFALLVAAAVITACSPIAGYCQAAAECDDFEAILLDPVGESNDSVNVCIAATEGSQRALRANEEEGCYEEANLREAYFACVADVFAKDRDDACDGFVLNADRNPCFDELDDATDQAGDNGDDCSANEE